MNRLERVLLETIFRLQEGVYDPGIFRAIFMAGGPASGKSYVASMTTGGLGLKIVDVDELTTILLDRHGLSRDMTTYTPEQEAEKERLRKSAKKAIQKRQLVYEQGRLGLIIDGTGADFSQIATGKASLEELGYDCFMIFVNTPEEEAVSRGLKRGEEGYATIKGSKPITAGGYTFGPEGKWKARHVGDDFQIDVGRSMDFRHQLQPSFNKGDENWISVNFNDFNYKGGRVVAQDITRGKWKEAQRNLTSFKSLFKSNFVEVDNSGSKEIHADTYNKVYKLVMRFVKQPLKNPIAISWMRDHGARI